MVKMMIKKWAPWNEVSKALITMMLLVLIPTAIYNQFQQYQFDQIQKAENAEIDFYKNAPIEEFYQNFGVVSSDVCYGDTGQTTMTERYAYNTPIGWKADAVKELFIHNADGTTSMMPEHTTARPFFVETSKNGISTCVVALPILEPGTYHWEINIPRMYLEYGVVRGDVPSIITSTFEVKNCSL